MSIGGFSLSLAVKDLKTSQIFYEKLGFQVVGGEFGQGWLILRSKDCTIGLFEGMFELNMLTFNPGWDNEGEEVEPFKDIRVLQEELREKGISFFSEVDLTTEGPGSFIIEDPDGNPILVDQHR